MKHEIQPVLITLLLLIIFVVQYDIEDIGDNDDVCRKVFKTYLSVDDQESFLILAKL